MHAICDVCRNVQKGRSTVINQTVRKSFGSLPSADERSVFWGQVVTNLVVEIRVMGGETWI